MTNKDRELAELEDMASLASRDLIDAEQKGRPAEEVLKLKEKALALGKLIREAEEKLKR